MTAARRRRVSGPFHRPAVAALRGSAAGARAGPLHRRRVGRGPGLRGVRALAARSCRRRLDRRRGGARQPGRAGGAHRERTMSPTATSASRTIPIRRMPTTSGFPPSLRRRSGKFSTSSAAAARGRAACAMSARRSRWWWRRALAAARDAAEAVAVDYDVLPAVSDVEEALAEARRRCGRTRRAISRSTTRSATAPRSRRRSRARISWSSRRSAASASSARCIEPRAAIGSYDESERQYTLISGCQGAHRLRKDLARCSRCRRSACARSARTSAAPSDRASISIPSRSRWCGRRAALGRPVKWTGDRTKRS